MVEFELEAKSVIAPSSAIAREVKSFGNFVEMKLSLLASFEDPETGLPAYKKRDTVTVQIKLSELFERLSIKCHTKQAEGTLRTWMADYLIKRDDVELPEIKFDVARLADLRKLIGALHQLEAMGVLEKTVSKNSPQSGLTVIPRFKQTETVYWAASESARSWISGLIAADLLPDVMI